MRLGYYIMKAFTQVGVVCLTLQTSCSGDGRGTLMRIPGNVDATQTTISVNSTSVAVVSGQLIVTLTLRDAGGMVVPYVTPAIEATSTLEYGSIGTCTTSGSDGASTCIVTANAVNSNIPFRMSSPVTGTNSSSGVSFVCPTDNVAGFSGGDGTAGNPYQVCKNSHITTIQGNTGLWGSSFIQIASVVTGVAPNAIGNNVTAFSGTFNGAGYEIRDYSYSNAGTDYAGFFGKVTGTLSNITLRNVTLVARTYVGSLAGQVLGGSVSNCHVVGTATVQGNQNADSSAGGLVGYLTGTISGSSSNASVTGLVYVGGLVGRNFTGGSIASSYATGAVTGSGAGTPQLHGGLVGLNEAAISDSYATGNLTATSNAAGGLVGHMAPGSSLTRSYATGNVSGLGLAGAGGAIGYMTGGTVTESWASGNIAITGYDSGGCCFSYGGGFLGYIETGGTVTNSYATGAVSSSMTGSSPTGGSFVGGFVGRESFAGITYAYSTGTVTGESDSFRGGFVGRECAGTDLHTAFWNMTTSGVSFDGGGSCGGGPYATGITTTQMQTQTTFTGVGWDFTTIWEMATSGNLFPILLWQ